MFYKVCKVIAGVLAKLLFSIRCEGAENIPEGKGYILASNHRCLLDPVFIGLHMKAQLHFMAKAELFRWKPFAWLITKLGAFPVERGTGDTSALTYAEQLIEEGKVLAIFPEGTRSKDGTPGRAKSGTAMIAGKTGADVLVCAVCYEGHLCFRKRVTVRFGKLIPNAQLGLQEIRPGALKIASKYIMSEIVNLLEVPQ